MVAQHYRWDFIGLSTDSKPTPATSEKVVDGSTFYCSDNSKLYVFFGDTWYEKTATGGGGASYTAGDGITISDDTISIDSSNVPIKTLTTADYNYPISNPDGISLGLLEAGLYKVQDNNVYVYLNSKKKNHEPELFLVSPEDTNLGSRYGLCYYPKASASSETHAVTMYRYSSSTGQYIPNSMTNLADEYEMSQVITQIGSSAPTTSTKGRIGQQYYDKTNAKLYLCTDILGSDYTWTALT